jgi:hypothetical protein
MAAYTFIANHKGGIYVRQVSAGNILQACRIWADELTKWQDIPDLDTSKFLKSFSDDLKDLPPVPLNDTPNVWGFTVGSGKNFMTINIVKTEMKTIETQQANDEPEYSEEDLIEINPDFRP